MWDSIKRYLLINILMYNHKSIGSLICGNSVDGKHLSKAQILFSKRNKIDTSQHKTGN